MDQDKKTGTDNKISRLALLSTMGELHTAPLDYDLHKLKYIITEISPDLLCAEITLDQWEESNLSDTSIEVLEALLPAALSSDIVVVPVASSPEKFSDFKARMGWRKELGVCLDQILEWGIIKANTPEAINGFLFDSFCHTVCGLNTLTWSDQDRVTWEEQNREIATNIIQAVRRDAGRRVLVVVQCQRAHKIENILKNYSGEIEIVPYQNLYI
jgi:hypothetical protein